MTNKTLVKPNKRKSHDVLIQDETKLSFYLYYFNKTSKYKKKLILVILNYILNPSTIGVAFTFKNSKKIYFLIA